MTSEATTSSVRFRIEKELAFAPAEFEARIQATKDRMNARGIDLLLVQHPPNVAYLSGYQSKVMFYGETMAISLDGEVTLMVLEWEAATAWLHAATDRIETFSDLSAAAAALAALSRRVPRSRSIGLECASGAVTARRFAELRAQLGDANVVDASGLVESVRVIKSPAEIAHMRSAARITDLGIAAAVSTAREGVTDNDVAAAAYAAMIGGGGEFMSVDPCILSGAHTGVLHASHKRRTIKRGDAIVMEMGAVYQRYTAPLQRTISIGVPNERLRQLSNVSFATLDALQSVLAPGVSSEQVASQARALLAGAGPDAWWHGGVAYSIGLAFPPNWVEGSFAIGGTGPLREPDANVVSEGMVLHLPISLRIRGQLGVMQSETVVITSSGCERLSQAPRELFVR